MCGWVDVSHSTNKMDASAAAAAGLFLVNL